MGRGDSLESYRTKRDFSRTPEPRGGRGRPRAQGPIFVVQKHAARRLHYDFRIEIDGVLKSWAVPKGPSTDPRQKRLAMPTEDHPLDYADFEGTIEEGQYGSGSVIVWDIGSVRAVQQDDEGNAVPLARSFQQGLIQMHLEGHKLQGGFALIRTRPDKSGGVRWLLVKKRDRWADASADLVRDRPESVLTGRTIEQLSGQEPSG